nr:unnamed protein product [Callosobruchus analis]
MKNVDIHTKFQSELQIVKVAFVNSLVNLAKGAKEETLKRSIPM